VGRLGVVFVARMSFAQTCGKLHTEHRCFSCLDDAWRAEFGDEAERPCWAELLRSGFDIFALDYDAILAAMYALSVSAEGDCYLCVLPDPGASRCFFCDSTTLTPLPAPVPIRLADPSVGPVLARSSTVLPCPAVPSGSLSRLHLPLFSTNLVSTAALQDAMVTTTTPGGPVAAPCSCRLLSHQTLLWHHHLGHPSLQCLRGMHSRLLVSGLPRSLPPLPPSPAPPCLPCAEGRQRAAPHSSFPPTIAPLQTLHMDVKGEVPDVLMPWIRAVRLQLRERFREDLPVLRLHSDRGAPHWLSHGGGSYLHDPCDYSPFSVAVCGPVRCASAQPLAPCLLAGDLAYTALDREGWRCVGDPGPPPIDPLPPQGPAPSSVSQVDPLPGTVRVEVGVDSGAARGAATGGDASRGAEPARAEPGGAESEGAESGGYGV
ncbi:unnamed protein product, partial [Closterium sp. NIES-53]